MIEECTQLRGSTRIGGGATIGPHSTLIDALIGDGVSVVHSHLVRCEVRQGASVGPFAYLRPDALLRERSKVGTFVEVKNSDIGAGSKVPHLSYVGDADIGESSNLGARLDHRQLRWLGQAPHDDRRARARRRGHLVRGAGDRRRRRLDGRRIGGHGRCRRPARLPSRDRASATSSAIPNGAARGDGGVLAGAVRRGARGRFADGGSGLAEDH